MKNEERKLQNGMLLDEYGELNESGYGTSLIKTYRRNDIKASKFKIKEWDYYLVYNDKCGVAFTVADNSYMGLVSASFLDFEKGDSITKSPISLMPMGNMNMPESSKIGDVIYKKGGNHFEFLNNGTERKLKVKIKDFFNNKPLVAEFLLTDEPEDNMVIATPFPENPKAFYYNQKIVGMKAHGYVKFDGEKIVFDRADTTAILDWGRGVWTYHNTWYWGAASGYVDDKSFGFNIGYGFGDTTSATENMIFYEGKAHKLDDIVFHIPKDLKGEDEFLRPWTFTSSDNRFNMDFIPIHDRADRTKVGPLLSDQHQVFGLFSGTVVLDDGIEITIKDFLGFAEKVENKW